MIIVGVVLLVLVLGALAAALVARLDVPGAPEVLSTSSAQALPSGPLTAADVHDLRFDQTARGYRMEQVDAALRRLADELADRDAEIARLRHGDALVTVGQDRGVALVEHQEGTVAENPRSATTEDQRGTFAEDRRGTVIADRGEA